MIYLISGVPGSGKSTIANELVKKVERGYLIETDLIRDFVKTGYASPARWTIETTKQFELATYNTCVLAKNAEKYGFTVVIDDAVSIEQEKIYLAELPQAVRIWLDPSLEVITSRNKSRGKFVDEDLIKRVYENKSLNKINSADNWNIIDTSNLNVDETLERISSLSS